MATRNIDAVQSKDIEKIHYGLQFLNIIHMYEVPFNRNLCV